MRATFFALAAALFSTGALAGPITTSVIVHQPYTTTQYYQSEEPHFTYITIQSPAPSVTATTIASCIRNCGSYSYNEPGAVTTTQVLQPSFTVFPITESRSATAFTIQTSSVYGPGPSASASPATSAIASSSASASASPVASDSRTTLFATGVPSASLSLNSTSTASVDPLNTINSNGAMGVAVGSAFAVVVGAVSVLALL